MSSYPECRHGVSDPYGFNKCKECELEELRADVERLRSGYNELLERHIDDVAEIERLRSDLGKLHGAATAYVSDRGPTRGALFRDLCSTVDLIDGARLADYGWPAVYERLANETERLRMERDEAKTEVERLRVLDGNDEHPENRCEKCGGRNITWFTDSPLWNAISGDCGILCPICFAQMAEKQGIVTSWKLCEENESTELRVEVEHLRQQHDVAVRSTARQLEHEDAAPFDECECKLCQALLEARDLLSREDRLKQRISELEAELQPHIAYPRDMALDEPMKEDEA